MTDYNDGNRHLWDGGDCPVHPKSEVKIWNDNGACHSIAKDLHWGKHPFPIIVFQVTKQHFDIPEEIWIGINSEGWLAYFNSKESAERENIYRQYARIVGPFRLVAEPYAEPPAPVEQPAPVEPKTIWVNGHGSGEAVGTAWPTEEMARANFTNPASIAVQYREVTSD
jgi:hypothetical protein